MMTFDEAFNSEYKARAVIYSAPRNSNIDSLLEESIVEPMELKSVPRRQLHSEGDRVQ